MNDPSKVDGSISYSLDPVGNRLSDQSNLGPIGSTSTSFNADDQSQAETYDNSGDTATTGGNTYGNNSWLKLTSMNGGQVRLAYNGLGQLVSKATNGVTTQYLIDDLSPTGYPQVVEELVNGQVTRQYAYGLERISELQMVNNAPTASFYQYDGHGTVRMLTNAAGAVTDAYEYDAFGNLISSAGTTPNVYLYRGERYDTDPGLYYLRARWYNPVTGRFMTRDPYEGSIYDPASLHRYNYARANPVNFIDPSGRDSATEYPLLSLNTLAKAVALTAAGEAVSCAYYSLASATDLVGQHIGQDIQQIGLLWQGCEARITVLQHVEGIGINLLGIGAGRALGAGIGWLLENAEQGFWPRLLTEEEGSFGPRSGPIPNPGGVFANNFKDYENAIRGLFAGDQSLATREFSATVDGIEENGVADAVTTIGNMPTAIEAKFTADRDGSIYNPEAPVGTKPFAQEAVQEMIEQANLYSQGFSGGVLYYTNSEALAAYYTQAFQQAGITNFQFVITSAIPY